MTHHNIPISGLSKSSSVESSLADQVSFLANSVSEQKFLNPDYSVPSTNSLAVRPSQGMKGVDAEIVFKAWS